MSETVRIQAEVLQHDRQSCRFTVDRSVFKEGFARFRSAQDAQGSALVERLFAIQGVADVILQGAQVTVRTATPMDWRMVGPLIGQAIRTHLASGEPAVSAEVLKNRPAEDSLREKVQKILDQQINPAVASHGGVISLLDVKGTTLYIKMGGGCQGCGMADVTLREGIEEALKTEIPEITQILDVTDHAGGKNPYYAGARH